MEIRTYVVWGWQRWLIYVVPAVAVTAAVVWFITTPTPEYAPSEKSLAPAIPIAWWAIVLSLFLARSAYAKTVSWITKDGISVHAGKAEAWFDQRRSQLDTAVWEVVAFWVEHLPRLWPQAPQHHEITSRVVDYLNGTHLHVEVTDEPIVVPRHGIKARGLLWPKRIVVSMKTEENKGLVEPLTFWSLVRHETGHAVMEACGVPQESQHALMTAAGWRDA